MRESRALPVEPIPASAAPAEETQSSNRAAKADRLPGLIPASFAAENAAYALASAPSETMFDRTFDLMRTATLPDTEARKTGEAGPSVAALAFAPIPPERPKRRLPPPPKQTVFLDDAQIASLKDRLRLTPEQAQFWPGVEAALRYVVQTQFRGSRMKHADAGKANIDVNSPDVQRLIQAATPLLMRLREDQKREVRKLARVIGLHSVASQI
jgi:hypothetical protein